MLHENYEVEADTGINKTFKLYDNATNGIICGLFALVEVATACRRSRIQLVYVIRRSHYTTVGQTVCAAVAQCEHYVQQFVKQVVKLSHSVNAV